MIRRILAPFLIVVGLVLTLPACSDLSDVLCHPAGHCPDAPDGLNKAH